MSRAYVPGPEADAIVQQQLAKGYYSDADDVVRVGLLLLQQSEAELEELSRLIEDEQAAYDRVKESGPRLDAAPASARIFPALHHCRQE